MLKKNVDVDDIVGDAPLNAVALSVLVLSFVVVMLDGYDLLCISFAAPSLARELGIEVSHFGPIFSAGFAGLLVGGLVLSPLGDRVGRKTLLLLSVFVFGLFSLLPIFGVSYEKLLAYRFVTGLGLGAAMPCAAALTAEYAPRRYRGLFVNLMFAGIAAGGVIGGFLASRTIPVYGWQAAFWIGGLAPLLAVPLLWILMPESVTFLALSGTRRAYIARVLNRIVASTRYTAGDAFIVNRGVALNKGRVPELFKSGRRAGTLLIWAVSFCSLFAFGIIVSWLPAVMTNESMPLHTAILAPVMLNLGGVLGTVLLGTLFQKLGPTAIIAAALALAATSVLFIKPMFPAPGPVLFVVFATGIFLLGSVNSTNALMAAFYPTKLRTTGVGWALGIGRIGGVVGPAAGGVFLSMRVDVWAVFLSAAAVATLGVIAILVFGVWYPNYRRPAQTHEGDASPDLAI